MITLLTMLLCSSSFRRLAKVCLLPTKHEIRKKFQTVFRHLINKGYIDGHGKNGKAGSLSPIGKSYVIGIIN